MSLIILVLSMPTESATVRMRAWRALKGSGAAVLRDGVYLMPSLPTCVDTLQTIAADVNGSGGSAYVLRAEAPEDIDLARLFDRSEDYASLMAEIAQARASLREMQALDVTRQARRLRRSLTNLIAIDFYPGEAKRQTELALGELELACARALAPDEPHAVEQAITIRNVSDYQGRKWATRRRPWVDRLASAWLIRRFIDAQATFLWLENPADCPPDALGFDFDDASFSHVGNRVTVEVLAASFALDPPGLTRLSQLVHYLDVGGLQPPEAAGVESVLAGLRQAIEDDDHLLEVACGIFDSLLLNFAAAPAQT